MKALESGRYKQGKGQLCTIDGEHCCLGVAAKTMRKKFMLSPGGFIVEYSKGYLTSHEDIGLRDHWGSFDDALSEGEAYKYFENGGMRGVRCLSQANDKGATHKQIARFIRENPERVFTKSV